MKSPFIHLVLVSLLCVLSLVGYSTWYATITAKSARATLLQDTIDTKVKNIYRLNTTKTVLADSADDELMVQRYFVPETGVVAFIDSLESRGRSRGASVSVRSVSTSGGAPHPALEFSISIAGTFDAVMRTIGSIEYAPYAISISNVSITQEEKGNWYADMKLLVGSRPASTATTL